VYVNVEEIEELTMNNRRISKLKILLAAILTGMLPYISPCGFGPDITCILDPSFCGGPFM